MDIKITKQKDNRYELQINGEVILVHEQLSIIVSKIEQFAKMYYLPNSKSGGVAGKLNTFMFGE